ncbi:MAG: hypothetical protein ACYSWP_08580 [Planctomycetota bacterium]
MQCPDSLARAMLDEGGKWVRPRQGQETGESRALLERARQSRTVGYKYLSDVESPDVQDLAPLAVVGRGGRRILREIATIVSPDTILAWHRKLIARTTYRPLGQTTPGCC